MKKLSRIMAFVICAALSVSLFAGCNTQEPITSDDRTVVDMAGREVILPEKVDKIATFGSIGVINGFVMLFGDGDKIINDMSPSFNRERYKFAYKFAPQLSAMPMFENASREIEMETVLAGKPDVCLSMTKEQTSLLEEKGLCVVYLEWKNQEDVATCMNLLGQVLNKKDLAKKYLDYFDEIIAKADSITARIPEEQRKTVLYGNIVNFSQPHVIAEWWIKKAGGISVTDDGRSEETLVYTLENLLQWNPDLIIASDNTQLSSMQGDARMSQMKAVKNLQVFTTPTVAHNWGNRTIEQPLMILWTLNKLYPEEYTREELAKDIRAFYSEYFHYELTDGDLDEIIDGAAKS